MSRLVWAAVGVTSLALASAGVTLAASLGQPSGRSCLVAWNATGNQANRVRLMAERPIAGLQLLPGIVGNDTVKKGSPPMQTATPACLLAVAKPGEIRIVTGLWATAGVSRWSFGRPILTSKPFFANIRLLSDGRVTKIDRR